MSDLEEASKGLIAALKGNDQETLAAAIEAASGFDSTPGDDRQRLRGRFLLRQVRCAESCLAHAVLVKGCREINPLICKC